MPDPTPKSRTNTNDTTATTATLQTNVSQDSNSSSNDLSIDANLGKIKAELHFEKPILAASASVPRSTRRPNRKKTRRRGFGISTAASGLGGQRQAFAVGGNPHDYEQKYAEDDYCEELSPNARVWRVYQDEADVFDNELVEGWKDTIDVLLVFAGLFSAVVTTFVVQTSQAFQQNYAQVTAALLTEMVNLQRAAADGVPSVTIPSSPLTFDTPFSSASSDDWVNGLWFTSLAFSLSTALLSVLIKQWIQHYVSSVSGTVRDRVYIRQYRLMGLKLWLVPVIVGLLPLLLHISLLLFLTGLIVFLVPLNTVISIIIAVITISAYVAYAISNLLPLKYPNCPYKTPLSTYSYLLFQYLSAFVASFTSTFPRKHSTHVGGLRDIESRAVKQSSEVIEAEALLWLFTASSNPTVASVVLQSLAGLRADSEAKSVFEKKGLNKSARTAFTSCFSVLGAGQQRGMKDDVDINQVERLGRSLVLLGETHDTNVRDCFSCLIQEGMRLECPELVALGHCQMQLNQEDADNDDVVVRSSCRFFASSAKSGLQLHPAVWSYILDTCFMECRFDDWRASTVDIQAAWQHAFNVFETIPQRFYNYNRPIASALREPLTAISLANPDNSTVIKTVDHLHALLCRKLDRYIRSPNPDRRAYFNHILLSGLNYLAHSSTKITTAPQTEKVMTLLLVHVNDLLNSPRFYRINYAEGRTEFGEICQSMQNIVESDILSGSHTSFSSCLQFLTVYQTLIYHSLAFTAANMSSWLPETPPEMCSSKVIEALIHSLRRQDCTNTETTWKLRTIICDILCEWFRAGSIFAFEAFRLGGGIEALRQLFTVESKSDSILGVVHHDRLWIIAHITVQFATCTLSLRDEMEVETFNCLIDYLYEPSNLLWFCQVVAVSSDSGVSLSADYTRLMTLRSLAQIRPSDPVWQYVIQTRVQNTHAHESLHYSVRQEYTAAYEAIEALKGILGLKDDPELRLHEYVCGDDVVNVPRHLAEIDGVPVYAPYTIPFRTLGEQTVQSLSSFHASGRATIYWPSSELSSIDSVSI